MKQHKHAELIKAWSDGAQIEFKCGEEWVDFMAGTNNWHECMEYRIKPREFENGAFYPVVYFSRPNVARYYYGHLAIVGESSRYEIGEFDWIGDKLEIEWPE